MEINKNLAKFLSLAALFSATTTLIIATILNLNVGLRLSSFSLLLLLIVALFFIFSRKKVAKNLLLKISSLHIPLWTLVAAILLGLTFRLGFIALSNHHSPSDPLTDAGVHWYGAKSLVENGELDPVIDDYEALYPYLGSYTFTLSLFMRVFGQNYAAVVISNVLFDILSGALLYFFLLKVRNKSTARLGVILWALNPIEIVFCGISLALIVTNFFIIAAIYTSYLLLTSLKKPKISLLVPLAILVGFTLSLGNIFRPIFIIFLIALLLTLVYYFLRTRKALKYTLLAALILLVSFFGSSKVLSCLLDNLTKHPTANFSTGWSFFVGANYDTKGHWSKSDSTHFFEDILPTSNYDYDLAQKEAFSQGIARYRQLSPLQLLYHLLNKTTVLFTATGDAIHDYLDVFPGLFAHLNLYEVLKAIISLYALALIILTLIYLLRLRLKKPLSPTKFLLLCFISGFTLASLLVEVMDRYLVPLSVIFLILSICAIIDTNEKQSKSLSPRSDL